MNYHIFDIETYPLPVSEISKHLPDDLKNPQLPDELRQPVEPEWKVPKYGGDLAKQQEWTENKRLDWRAKITADQEKWRQKIEDDKMKFFDSCSLNPKLSTLKLFGVHDLQQNASFMAVFDEDGKKLAKLSAGIAKEKRIDLHTFTDEREALRWSFDYMKRATSSWASNDEMAGCLVSYFGNNFDLPYLFRRAWRLGVKPPMSLMRGRYWQDSIIDLHEVFAFYDRSYKTGGLDNICDFLNVAGKTGKGEHFAALWDKDPIGAIIYCDDDLQATKRAAIPLLGI